MADHVIQPTDSIHVDVFQEPEASTRDVPVDASGRITLPLIGRVQASGMTAEALADMLRDRYRRYYVNPRVSVIVDDSASQRVTVQGQVREPGLYDVRGGITLLDAIALSKGETSTAALNEVLILRTIEGERRAALFDVNRIRRGDDPDPALLAKDVIVVGHSDVKQAWRDLLRAAPLFNVFT